MKMGLTVVFLMTALSVTPVSDAATLIESTDGKGTTQKMWLEGNKARVDTSGEKSYMLLDAQANKMFVVDREERSVLDMSSYLGKEPGPDEGRNYAVTVTKKGGGPKIAGYPTVHYELLVDRKKCSDEYLSEAAMKDVQSNLIFETMSKMGAEQMEGIPSGMLDPCDRADAAYGEIYSRKGLPLRSVNRDGSLDYEVTKISKNAATPPGGFEVPSGYTVKDMKKMMEKAMPGMPPMTGMPEDVTPEQMQEMMQEMMKQMGQ